MKLHPRALLPLLQARLRRWPIVVLTGARQTGKTTLVRDLLPDLEFPGPVYLSLDDPDERLRLAADPVRRLDHGTRLVILDEIQKQPALLDAVKLLADRKKGHRFLLLGSSQILLLERVRETLAGRATLLELWPLALVERGETKTVPVSALDRVWNEGPAVLAGLARMAPKANEARRWRARAEDAILWGGYPALELLDQEERRTWLRDFRRTYLERDLADLGRVADLDQFALAQRLLATRTAQLLSYSTTGRELGVATNTVKRYVRFLELSYQVVLLRPLLPTLSASLVKTPKLFWTDTGLARLLSERWAPTEGSLFETAVLAELLRWSSWQREPPSISFFRTRSGREVDFVVSGPGHGLALEVKASQRVTRQEARPLEEYLGGTRLPKAVAAAHGVGLVVFAGGREIEQLAPNVFAVPFWRLFGPAGG